MMDETMNFKGTGWDLKDLSDEIVQKLMKDGYTVQSNVANGNRIIQAKKDGVLRDIVTANRAFSISIAGEPNDFTVKVGIGKIVQNLGVAAAEAILFSEFFLAVDVPEMLWTQYVHNGIVKQVEQTVGSKPSRRTMSGGRAVVRGVSAAGTKSKRLAMRTGRKTAAGLKKGGRTVKRKITAAINA